MSFQYGLCFIGVPLLAVSERLLDAYGEKIDTKSIYIDLVGCKKGIFCDVFLCTAYAHAYCRLLCEMADVYPNYDKEGEDWDRIRSAVP